MDKLSSNCRVFKNLPSLPSFRSRGGGFHPKYSWTLGSNFGFGAVRTPEWKEKE